MNVLIVFYSRGGETERLALSVGVGAIQARANIRLRRLLPEAEVNREAMTLAQRESFERMSRDYVAPREADPPWADVLILAVSPEGAGQVEAYVEGLPRLQTVTGKVAAPLAYGDSVQALRPIYAAAASAGLIVVPTPAPLDAIDAWHSVGRRLVEYARALKAAHT